MNVVLVTAEELAAGRVVLAPTTEREYLADNDKWYPWGTYDLPLFYEGAKARRRERTVSQTLPESQCPTCGGDGYTDHAAGDLSEEELDNLRCPSCEGRGSLVAIHLAIEQWRTRRTGPWSDWFNGPILFVPDQPVERRQAIVGYVTPTVLPVVDDDELDEDAARRNMVRIFHTEDGSRGVCLNDDRDHPVLVRNVTDEPWAQGLEAGSVVLEWDAFTPIDPPIVEVWVDTDPGALALDGSPEHMAWVPLSLEQGQLTEVN